VGFFLQGTYLWLLHTEQEVAHSLCISAELFSVNWIVADSVIVLMNPTFQRFELNTVHLYQH